MPERITRVTMGQLRATAEDSFACTALRSDEGVFGSGDIRDGDGDTRFTNGSSVEGSGIFGRQNRRETPTEKLAKPPTRHKRWAASELELLLMNSLMAFPLKSWAPTANTVKITYAVCL